MSLKFFIATSAAAVAMSAQAALAVTSFDFTGPAFPIFGSDIDPAQFTQGDYTVDVTAHDLTLPTSNASVNQNGLGLGVYLGGFDSPQNDNIRDKEMLVFELGRKVDFVDVTITAGLFDTAIFFATNDSDILDATTVGEALAVRESGFRSVTSDVDFFGVTGSLNLSGFQYLVAGTPGLGPVGVFSANTQGFRVAGLSVVPAPLGLPLLASAFAAAWLVRRRAA